MWQPIPGETPIDDLSGLKVKGVRLRKELDVLEAENILKAVEKYFTGRLTRKKAPFDYTWILMLHAEMFGDVWAWAGRIRHFNTNIGVPHRHVEGKLYDLLKDMVFWRASPWALQAAMLHHRAVAIHPFPNGNGRWARLLANIWLRLNAQPYTLWPEETVGEVSVVRTEYLDTLHAADQGDYVPLQKLHERLGSPVAGKTNKTGRTPRSSARRKRR